MSTLQSKLNHENLNCSPFFFELNIKFILRLSVNII